MNDMVMTLDELAAQAGSQKTDESDDRASTGPTRRVDQQERATGPNRDPKDDNLDKVNFLDGRIGRGNRLNQLDALRKLLGQDNAEFFHDRNGRHFITTKVGLHRETFPLMGEQVTRMLRRAHMERLRRDPSSAAINETLELARLQAEQGACREVNIRIAWHADSVLVDLADDDRHLVRIRAGSWDVIPAADLPEARFLRPPNMLALPVPTSGGDIDALSALIPGCSGDALSLIKLALVSAMLPLASQHPLVLQGVQGAKVKRTAQMVSQLVDPQKLGVPRLRTKAADLLRDIRQRRLLAYRLLDNERVRPRTIDMYRQIAAGEPMHVSGRAGSEQIEEVRARPVVLCGDEKATNDLGLPAGALTVDLPREKTKDRLNRAQFNRNLESARPGLLGGLLDLTAKALEAINGDPQFLEAEELDVLLPGSAKQHFGGLPSLLRVNRYAATTDVLDSDPLAVAIQTYLPQRERGTKEGTATEIRRWLLESAKIATHHGDVPDLTPDASRFSRKLRGMAADLLRIGILFEDLGVRASGRKRLLRLTYLGVRDGGRSSSEGGSGEEPDRDSDQVQDSDSEADQPDLALIMTKPKKTAKGKPIDAFEKEQVREGKWKPAIVPAETLGLIRPLEIYRAKRAGNYIKPLDRDDLGDYCPSHWTDLKIGKGACGLRCRACFLMATHRAMANPARHVLYENTTDFETAVRGWLQEPDYPTLGLGIDCSDSLLYEGDTGHASRLIPLFASKETNPKGAKLVLLTKSTNVHYLEGLPTENVVVSFSLNPEPIADLWEGKFPDGVRVTPPIEARLAASVQAQEMGFEVRWRVEPLLTPDGWVEQYREFFQQAVKMGCEPTRITLGTYREVSKGLRTFAKRWGLPPMEWKPPVGDAKEQLHYHVPVHERVEAYRAVRTLIDEAWASVVRGPIVALCKEPSSVKKAVGLNPQHDRCNCGP